MTLPKPGDKLADRILGATLRAHLDDPIARSGNFHHFPPFPNVMGERLLHINMLSSLAGPNGAHRVPIILRGISDTIDIGSLQEPPQVPISGNCSAKPTLEPTGSLGESGGIWVTDSDHVDVWLVLKSGDVGPQTPPAQPDDPDPDLLAGPPNLPSDKQRQSQGRQMEKCLGGCAASKFHGSILSEKGSFAPSGFPIGLPELTDH
jgi:hypothetical protein